MIENPEKIQKKFFKDPRFLFFMGLGVLVLGFLFFGGGFSNKASFLGNFRASIQETLGDVFGFQNQKPVYEISFDDLRKGNLGDEEKTDESRGGQGESSDVVVSSEEKDGVKSAKEGSEAEKNAAVGEKGKSKNSLVGATEKSREVSKIETKKESAPIKVETPNCDFSSSDTPALGLSHTIIFNEVAWMGGKVSANDEWIELKNNSGVTVNLDGWTIKNQSEKIKIVFTDGKEVFKDSFLILERTDDNSALSVAADQIYSGAIGNDGDWLKLFDANCKLVDEINASFGWGRFGGDNDQKKTLERNLNDLGWHTSVFSGGTPKAKNSEPVLASGGEPADEEEATSTPPGGNPPPSQPPANQNPGSTKILISEVMAGSSASSDYEFVEIYNYGDAAVDLTGWTIKKKTSSGAESSLVAASRLSGKVIGPGKYMLLGHEGGYTGAVLADVTWPASYSLAYTNNTVTIYSATGVQIDQVTWTDIPKDKSYSRMSLDIGAGFTILDTPGPQNGQ